MENYLISINLLNTRSKKDRNRFHYIIRFTNEIVESSDGKERRVVNGANAETRQTTRSQLVPLPSRSRAFSFTFSLATYPPPPPPPRRPRRPGCAYPPNAI